MASALRYWHTLRHLQPVQFYGRLWFRLARPQPDLGAAPSRRPATTRWQAPTQRAPSLLGPAQFRFLGETGDLDKLGWDNPACEKLWRYNLHYFDDLNAEAAPERLAWHTALLARWVAENPAGQGTGWEPYPTSLRIVNWIKWALAGGTLPGECLRSLAVQARWLTRRLEWHLLGNHLFANAKALVFAGLFFQGEEAEQWLVKGLCIIERELPEQVLADGGNFERSPMYHAIFLEDLLDLVNLALAHGGLSSVSTWREVAQRMLGWLQAMTHPDGEIALFNDAAFGVAPKLAALVGYARRLGIELPCSAVDGQSDLALLGLADSGYVRLQSATALALLDVAPIGPDYLPGHAHADTLSFELSVLGQRVVVNGGTSRYGLGRERSRERGTAAHSTVTVAGEDSSEVWGGFRVARRAHPFGLSTSRHAGSVVVACSHDGYRRLPGRPVHRRQWVLDTASLLVSDTVEGGNHLGVARFVLHPEVSIERIDATDWRLSLPDGSCVRAKVTAGYARLEMARYAAGFGRVIATHCLAVDLVDGRAETRFIWN